MPALKTWNGSAWVTKPLKVYAGGSFVQKAVKYWNGSTWVTVQAAAGGGADPAFVRAAKGLGTTATVTASFPSAPAVGNLIILAFSGDDYNNTPNSPANQRTGMEQQTWHGGYVWDYISNGSNSFAYTIGSATKSSWVLLEFSGIDTVNPYRTSNGQNRLSGVAAYTTPTITPAAGKTLLVAAFGSSWGSAQNMSGDLTSWTNSFIHAQSSGPASGVSPSVAMGAGYRIVTADGSTGYSAGASYPFSTESQSAMIIAFKGA
jgi:hypothetical protein